MDDYISRKKLAKHLADVILGECPMFNTITEYSRGVIDGLECAYHALMMHSAADVVKVVRCKDCINWNGNNCITMYGLASPKPNDFCARGQKLEVPNDG